MSRRESQATQWNRGTPDDPLFYTHTKRREVRVINGVGANTAGRCDYINELKQVEEFWDRKLSFQQTDFNSQRHGSYSSCTVKEKKIRDLKPNCQKLNVALRQTVMCWSGVQDEQCGSDSDWGGVFTCIPRPYSVACATICLHARASTPVLHFYTLCSAWIGKPLEVPGTLQSTPQAVWITASKGSHMWTKEGQE